MTVTKRAPTNRRRRRPATTMQELEEPGQEAKYGGWSDLTIDILYLIADLLDIRYLVTMTAVCKEWRQVLLDDFRARRILEATSSPHHLPKLMLPGNSGDKDFIHWITRQHFKLNLEQPDGVKFCGSGHGWLVLLAKEDGYWQVKLFNPLTKEQIYLPEHPWLSSLRRTNQFIFKAIIVGNPSGTPDFAVAAIISTVTNSVSFVTARSKHAPKWTIIHSYGRQYNTTDIVYNRGILYTISDNLDQMLAYSMRTRKMKREQEYWRFQEEMRIPEGVQGQYPHYKSYLLEVSSRVYGVVRSLQLAGDPEPVDGSLMVCTLKNGQREREWVRVEDLGNCCLMLGENSSMALSPVPAKSGFRRNCVYFTRSRCLEKEIGEYDVGEYSLKDGTYQRFSFENAADYSLSPSIWLSFNCCRAAA